MDEGFGICGHKNSFSTGVKIGNYVEDRIGGELAKSSAIKPLQKLTECSASFIDPASMPDKSAHAPKENLNERFLLRQGLPYNLVFEHGQPHIPSSGELEIKYTPSSYDIGRGIKIGIPGRDTTRSRQLEMRREREGRETRNMYVSTSQSIVPAVTRAKQ